MPTLAYYKFTFAAQRPGEDLLVVSFWQPTTHKGTVALQIATADFALAHPAYVNFLVLVTIHYS